MTRERDKRRSRGAEEQGSRGAGETVCSHLSLSSAAPLLLGSSSPRLLGSSASLLPFSPAPPLPLAQVESLLATPALAALGAAAVTVPVAIHLLSRLRRKRQPWGAMRFLLAAIQAHKRRLQFEQLLLLLLRCLIVALLGLALAGPIITGLPAQRGRTIHLLLDDSLASRADASTGANVTRFTQLQTTAQELIGGLSADDRVQVWRAGAPVEPLTPEPTNDHPAMRRAIDALQPRYARSDLADALRRVTESLERGDGVRDESVVVLLSDLSASVAAGGGAGLADEAVLRRLNRQARLMTLRPTAGRSNVQVARLEPRRAMVVAEADRATIPVALEALRFGDLTHPATAAATIELIDPARADTVLAQAQRRVTWPAGQRRAAINADLAADATADRSLVLRARLETGAELNALREDDSAYAVVSVRKQLRVAIVAEPDDATGRLSPATWLSLALSPVEGGAIALQTVPPGNVERALESAGMDAVMVPRPQRLSEPAWRAVAALAQRGGLVWVFPETGGDEASWAGVMQRAFDLDDWSIAWEPVTSEDGWPAAALPGATPAPLRLLGADYEAMLRPVRAWRYLPIEAPPGDTWIAIEGTNAALVASKRVGLGQVVLSAAALDAAWTNLPAKPIFVPLLHETLRGVLGAQRGRVTQAVAGDQLALGSDFAAVSRLAPIVGEAPPLDVVRNEDDARPAQALSVPGVLAAESDAALKLAVNPDPIGGDLSAVDEQRVAQWLMPVEGWQWIDPSVAASALVRPVNVARLAWPLLWAVLALIVLETMLARWLSHAGASPADSLSHRLIARLAALRHEPVERKKAA